jgi:hypothetical protein
MKIGIVITLCLCIASIRAQESSNERISFSFEYARHHYAMDSLNEYYFDFMINEFKTLNKKISSGNFFALHFAIRPTKMMELGIKPYFQYGISQHTSFFPFFADSQEPIDSPVLASVTTRSFGIQISTSLYVQELLSKQINGCVLSRFAYAPELNFGIGFNSFFGYSQFLDFPYFNDSEHAVLFKNTSLFSQVGLKLEYAVSQKAMITAIGFRAGYQFFKTGTILRESGDEMLTPTGRVSHLDFSGFYYGIYLKLGK